MNMKRALVVIFVGLMLSALLAEMFPDVPKDHWAYLYVKNLYSKGIVIGYPDGTFKGEQPATRYEMAAVIARMYDAIEARLMSLIESRFKEIEKSEAGAEGKGECPGCEYIPNILESLNAISIQLQFHDDKIAELFDLIGQQKAGGKAETGVPSSKIMELEKEIAELKARVDALDVGDMSKKLQEIQNYIKLIKSIEQKSENVPQIMETLNSISIKLQEHDEAIGDLKAKVDRLNIDEISAKLYEVEKYIKMVESLKGKSDYIPEILEMINDLSIKVQAQEEAISDIKASMAAMKSEMKKGDVSAKIKGLEKETQSLSMRVDALKKTLKDVMKEMEGKGVPESVKKEIESIKEDLESVKENIRVLKITIQDVVKVITGQPGKTIIISERDELQNKQIAKINVELMKIWSKIKKIESKIESVKSEDNVGKKMEELEIALNNLKIDLTGVTSTLFEVARMATLNTSNTEELQAMEKKLEGKVKEVSENIAIVNGDIMRLYRISGELQRKVIGLSKAVDEKTAQDKAQDKDIAKIYDLLNEIYTKVYALEEPVSKIDRIESSVFGNAKLLRFIYEKLDKDEDVIRANTKATKSNAKSIESINAKLSDLESKVSANTRSIEDFQTTVEYLYDEIDNLKNQQEIMREGFFALKDDMNEEIKGVKDDLDDVHTKIQTIESVNSAQDRDIYTLYETTDKLEKTTDKLEKDTDTLFEGVSDLNTWKWINFGLALLGIVIGGVALYFVYQDP